MHAEVDSFCLLRIALRMGIVETCFFFSVGVGALCGDEGEIEPAKAKINSRPQFGVEKFCAWGRGKEKFSPREGN